MRKFFILTFTVLYSTLVGIAQEIPTSLTIPVEGLSNEQIDFSSSIHNHSDWENLGDSVKWARYLGETSHSNVDTGYSDLQKIVLPADYNQEMIFIDLSIDDKMSFINDKLEIATGLLTTWIQIEPKFFFEPRFSFSCQLTQGIEFKASIGNYYQH